MTIPKIIHFIWAGGDRPMPDDNLDIVKAWRDRNPDFAIWLWVDSKTASRPTVHHQNISIYTSRLGDRLSIKDIANNHDFRSTGDSQHARYEIDRLRPNYGASSDLLRYDILYQYGGAYFDSDVAPGEKSLIESGFFAIDDNQPRIYVDPNSQNTGFVGNDAFICTPRHPMMLAILHTALTNYALSNAVPQDDIDAIDDSSAHFYQHKFKPNEMTYRYDQSDYIANMTPSKTGPACVRQARNQFKLSDLTALVGHVPNTHLWIGTKLRVVANLTQVEDAIKATILFEAREMKMLRLDDHMNNLLALPGCTIAMAMAMIKEAIDKIHLDFKNINNVQLTYHHPETVEFCKCNNLLAKTYLFPRDKACQILAADSKYYETPIVHGIFGIDPADITKKFTDEDDVIDIERLKVHCEKIVNGMNTFITDAYAHSAKLITELVVGNPGNKDVTDYNKCIKNSIDNAYSAIEEIEATHSVTLVCKESLKETLAAEQTALIARVTPTTSISSVAPRSTRPVPVVNESTESTPLVSQSPAEPRQDSDDEPNNSCCPCRIS